MDQFSQGMQGKGECSSGTSTGKLIFEVSLLKQVPYKMQLHQMPLILLLLLFQAKKLYYKEKMKELFLLLLLFSMMYLNSTTS